ncbi:peroxiredoxin-like family protein [Dictyobacter aurantiacus]|uniref:thioredoxin-dependent peroxiredoxin n=1 Tax=Dictyobacter aurantiacus TaxID=1936993 RepID=A0A401ZLN0_9CHLR|nr:peroxiredoxin-like family protein [Dictyobacter aurantiacus]GCE07791.1 alkyl hydroperoxide reductase [Dictyobacter aurantiacus]
MTREHVPFEQELQRSIQKLQETSQTPVAIRAIFQQNTAALVQSGIAEHAKQRGEAAPNFALPNARGTILKLSDLLSRGPVVLTFYRGAWCPYCNLTLRAYQKHLPEIQQRGATLVAISPQTPDHSLATAEKWQLEFEVLSDESNQVARAYGLVFRMSEELRTLYQRFDNDLEAYNGDSSWELPMPGTFVIAQDGTIQLAFVDADYTHRLEPAEILDALHLIHK